MIALMITVGALALQANVNLILATETSDLVYYTNKVIALLSIKLGLDTIIEILFIFLIVFMINFKRKHAKLSVTNYIVIAWISILFLLCCF